MYLHSRRTGMLLFEMLMISSMVIVWWVAVVQLQTTLLQMVHASYDQIHALVVGRSCVARLQSGLQKVATGSWTERSCNLSLQSAQPLHDGVQWVVLTVERHDATVTLLVGVAA